MHGLKDAGLAAAVVAVNKVVSAKIVEARLAEVAKLEDACGFKQGSVPPSYELSGGR